MALEKPESALLMGATSLEVSSSRTKIRRKGSQEIKAVRPSMALASPCPFFILYSSGMGAFLRERAMRMVQPRLTTQPTMTGSSGPVNLATTSWGSTKETPETRVMPTMPFRALRPPPPTMTIRKGTRIIKGTICTTVVKARGRGSSPVTLARVTVGMPTEPKAVGKALASIHTRQAVRGFIPMPASMEAGMAMAVPKPAMPSMKPPKHQPMRSTSTRWSAETLVSICLMTSMAPVRNVRLYVKIAAMMTRIMGHRAEAKPSRAEVAQSMTGILQRNSASTMVMSRAPKHALWPAIFSPVSATISQMIGSSDKIPIPTISSIAFHPISVAAGPGRSNWCYQFRRTPLPLFCAPVYFRHISSR